MVSWITGIELWIPTGTESEPLIYLLKVLSTVWLFREKRHLCDTNKESQDLLADWSIKQRLSSLSSNSPTCWSSLDRLLRNRLRSDVQMKFLCHIIDYRLGISWFNFDFRPTWSHPMRGFHELFHDVYLSGSGALQFRRPLFIYDIISASHKAFAWSIVVILMDVRPRPKPDTSIRVLSLCNLNIRLTRKLSNSRKI